MTWGECRLAALQTMFANEGKTLTVDDSNQEYLDAMPAKANEALQQLCTVGRPRLAAYTVEIAEGAEETEAAGKLTLPTAAVRYKLKMTDYCPRWRCLQPELLMLDEPSMGLAPILVEQIFDIIQELHKAGATILLVEQNAQMALQVANRAYVLETGKITLSGSGKELLESDSIKKAYLGG